MPKLVAIFLAACCSEQTPQKHAPITTDIKRDSALDEQLQE